MAKPNIVKPAWHEGGEYEDYPVLDGPRAFEKASGSNGVPGPGFGSGVAEGYVQELLESFETSYPDAAADMKFIANQAKWAVGWKSFGRMIIEVF